MARQARRDIDERGEEKGGGSKESEGITRSEAGQELKLVPAREQRKTREMPVRWRSVFNHLENKEKEEQRREQQSSEPRWNFKCNFVRGPAR